MPGPRIELKTSLALPIIFGVLVVLPAVAGCVVYAPVIFKIIAIAVAIAYLALCQASAQRRLILDDDGVTSRGLLGSKSIAWNDVDHYTYWSMREQGYAAAGMGGGALLVIILIVLSRALGKKRANRKFTLGRLTIFAGDGRKLVIDTRFKKVADALDRSFAEIHPRLRSRPNAFAPFAINDTTLLHTGKGPIALADIDKITIVNARLSIRRRGKRLRWLSVHMRQVTNVMLLVEELADHGLIIDANGDVFVPPPVLEKLRAASARQAALPAAKIVRR